MSAQSYRYTGSPICKRAMNSVHAGESLSSRSVVRREGDMDELAAAAAVVAIATDANADEESALGLTSSTSMDVEAPEAADECLDVDKENKSGSPATRDLGAANPKVSNATQEPQNMRHAQPLTQSVSHIDMHRNALSRRLPWLCCSRWPTPCSPRARVPPSDGQGQCCR